MLSCACCWIRGDGVGSVQPTFTRKPNSGRAPAVRHAEIRNHAARATVTGSGTAQHDSCNTPRETGIVVEEPLRASRWLQECT